MPEISVIIPSYNTPKEHLEKLYNSLLFQTLKDFEVIIVDDKSDFDYYEIITDRRFRIEKMPVNGGPAKCRNRGAELADSDKIFFTDSDCTLEKNTLSEATAVLNSEVAVMGNTVTDVKSHFGKAVAYLGFPGGGILGFDKVWKVNKSGYTNSITSCNLAINREFFTKNGMFDTTFPVPGGEDTYFGKKIVAQNTKIMYNRNQRVHHVERGDYKSFKKWQITRGRGNFHIKRKLGYIGSFYRLRIWSFKNSLVSSGIYAPIVGFLIIMSFIYQKIGYKKEAAMFNPEVK